MDVRFFQLFFVCVSCLITICLCDHQYHGDWSTSADPYVNYLAVIAPKLPETSDATTSLTQRPDADPTRFETRL